MEIEAMVDLKNYSFRKQVTPFYYTSAPPGAGKTLALINITNQFYKDGESLIYSAPTKLLTEQFHNNLEETSKLPSKLITSNNHSKPMKTIIEELFKHNDIERALSITNKSLIEILKIDSFAYKNKFHLFIDESFDSIKSYPIKTSITSQFIFRNLDISDSFKNKDKEFVQLSVKDEPEAKAFVKSILSSPFDDPIAKEYFEMFSEISNENYFCFILKEDFDKAMNGQAIETSIFTECLPTLFYGFKSVTFLRANFERSITYKSFVNNGIKFKINQKIQKELLYSEYPKLKNTTIKYLTDNDFSKNMRNKDDNEAVILNEIIFNDIGIDNRFLLTTNNDSSSHIKKIIKEFNLNCEYVTPKSDGRNDLIDHDKVVFLAAMNPKINHIKGLENLNIDIETLKRDMYIESVIQFIWRGKIRKDPNAEYTIYVPDKRAALAISEGTHVTKIVKIKSNIKERDHKLGRTKTYDTKELRYKMSNARKKIYRQLKKNDYTFNFYDNVYSPIGMTKSHGSWNSMIDYFYELFKSNKPKSKKENVLFSTGIFDFSKSMKSKRGIDNHLHSSIIVLDFDKTSLTPDDVKKVSIFKEINCAFYSTSTKGNFRMIIDIDEALPATAFKCITQYIINTIVSETGDDGIDMASIQPTQLYYLPANDKTHSYFKKYGKVPLNVRSIITTSEFGKILLDHFNFEDEINFIITKTVDSDKINDIDGKKALDIFKTKPSHPNMFGFAIGLKKANYPYFLALSTMMSHEYCLSHKDKAIKVLDKIYNK